MKVTFCGFRFIPVPPTPIALLLPKVVSSKSVSNSSFIRKYLTEDLCRELNLFSYSYHKHTDNYTVSDISDEEGWKSVRNALISNVGLNGVPIVCVEDYEKRTNTLFLKHEHDGRDLELSYANKVYDNICYLWNDNVEFLTLIEGEVWEF